ncbi:MAG TPA: hypothetical protein VFV86_09820, partial [Nitrososphaeraceae archaeon]|nr:hypothetical protein [Nitrososphaeraceae archaeon]
IWPFDPINGTFHKNLEYGILPPVDTRYIVVSGWVKPNPIEDSHYVIDNFTFEEFMNQNRFEIGSYPLENMNSTNQKVVSNGKGMGVIEIRGASEGFNIVRTEPIPVRENSLYNYSINADLRNLTDFKIYVYNTRTDDVIVNSTKYGDLVSNGKILTLTPNSEIFTDLDIIKPSNYSISVHTNICKICTPLKLSITEDNGNSVIVANRNISSLENGNNIRNNKSSLEWLYLDNIYLERGQYKIKIYSDSQRDIDSVILYSSDNYKLDPLDIFNESEAPAQIVKYTKVDPTKYTVNINNATRPYIISFSESYDPFWTAHITYGNGNKSDTYSNSIPLYSIINGFYIDKLGNYTITIEYKPQQWFLQGGIVSIASVLILLLGCPLYVFILKNKHWKKVMILSKRRKR